MLTWVHFGDLHASSEDTFKSVSHLQEMVALVNARLADRVDFAYLPGDNANNGKPDQYQRILSAVGSLGVPLHAIPGDHDYEPGHLEAFTAFASVALPMSRVVNGHRCIFLDIVSAGGGGPDFRLSAIDRNRLNKELELSFLDPAPPVVFMHAYPGDVFDGDALALAFARANVAIVDTGHTHYNELLNDGWVIYAATRSTGQIEEDAGRPGFSVAAVDDGVVSWKIHPLDAQLPFVMITQPADRRLHRNRAHQSDGELVVRALVSNNDIVSVTGVIGKFEFELLPDAIDMGIWQAILPGTLSDQAASLVVTAQTNDGRIGTDSISYAGAVSRKQRGQRVIYRLAPTYTRWGRGLSLAFSARSLARTKTAVTGEL
ncbi:metallophosphoesterase family protein [Paraburkholderia sediminicola]|uniref:metallophosphoesterase family protein n=1 Tax=Paraburkholderia sediminicola TaxID=458836 RepID=UPI000F1D6970